MTLKEFELELKALNKDLSIRPNNVTNSRVLEVAPGVNQLASILYQGVEICTIPNGDIYEEKSGGYGVDLREDGRFIAHRTRPEALQIVKDKLAMLGDKEYADQFFGRGEYSEAALMRKDDPVPELVEEVTIEAKEVGSGMIEGKVEGVK